MVADHSDRYLDVIFATETNQIFHAIRFMILCRLGSIHLDSFRNIKRAFLSTNLYTHELMLFGTDVSPWIPLNDKTSALVFEG